MNQRFRTLLILGRVSNLPTVWSNCLAGWWLGGGQHANQLPLLLLGMSLLYTGGMFLNDAFDEEFDRLRQPERPIPAGKIPQLLVWRWGLGLLLAGILCLLIAGGWAAGAEAVALAFFILLYDFTHKFFMGAPWLMGACRFWVYVIAGTTGMDAAVGYGFTIFGGVALGFYVVGYNYLARRGRTRGPVPYGPIALLTAPVLLACMLNAGEYRVPALWVSLLLGLWVVRYVSYIFLPGQTNAGWIVRNLIAGMVLVDWVAVVPQIPFWQSTLVFVSLFSLAKSFQKLVPVVAGRLN